MIQHPLCGPLSFWGMAACFSGGTWWCSAYWSCRTEMRSKSSSHRFEGVSFSWADQTLLRIMGDVKDEVNIDLKPDEP